MATWLLEICPHKIDSKKRSIFVTQMSYFILNTCPTHAFYLRANCFYHGKITVGVTPPTIIKEKILFIWKIFKGIIYTHKSHFKWFLQNLKWSEKGQSNHLTRLFPSSKSIGRMNKKLKMGVMIIYSITTMLENSTVNNTKLQILYRVNEKHFLNLFYSY